MAASAAASFAAAIAECALLLVKDPSRAPIPAVDLLMQVFGLTAAEARLTEALAAGRSLEQIGEERGTSYGTLRVQLKSVMSKTGTRRQGELIALVHRAVGFDVGARHDGSAAPSPCPLPQGEGVVLGGPKPCPPSAVFTR